MENKKNLAVGIFDSGMGGISVLGEVIKELSNEKFIYYGDSFNQPYTDKTNEKLKKLCINICDFLIKKGVKAIIVACNTATIAAIKVLREKYDIPILGVEPAVKLAADLDSDGRIIVMATPFTLRNKRFSELISKYGKGKEIVKLPCPNIIKLVESGVIDGEKTGNCIKICFEKVDINSVSSIVLGCTHFGFLVKVMKKVLGESICIIDGNRGVAKHLRNVLSQKNMLTDIKRDKPYYEIYNSAGRESIKKSKKLLLMHLKNLNV